MWLLWVNIDYTAVSQLSGATGAEHSHVLWCLLKGVISGLIPAPALPSPQPVHSSPLCTSACAALHQARVSQGSCSLQSDLRGGVSAQAPEVSQCSCSGYLGGTDWLTVWQLSEFICSSPPPSYMSSDSPCPPQRKLSVDFLCWQVRRDQLCGVER